MRRPALLMTLFLAGCAASNAQVTVVVPPPVAPLAVVVQATAAPTPTPLPTAANLAEIRAEAQATPTPAPTPTPTATPRPTPTPVRTPRPTPTPAPDVHERFSGGAGGGLQGPFYLRKGLVTMTTRLETGAEKDYGASLFINLADADGYSVSGSSSSLYFESGSTEKNVLIKEDGEYYVDVDADDCTWEVEVDQAGGPGGGGTSSGGSRELIRFVGQLDGWTCMDAGEGRNEVRLNSMDPSVPWAASDRFDGAEFELPALPRNTKIAVTLEVPGCRERTFELEVDDDYVAGRPYAFREADAR